MMSVEFDFVFHEYQEIVYHATKDGDHYVISDPKTGLFITTYKHEMVREFLAKDVWIVIPPETVIIDCSECHNPREEESDYLCNSCRKALYVDC